MNNFSQSRICEVFMIATELDQERRKLEDVNHPQHVAAVEGLSDYLTIMNLLYKSISRILESSCSLTTLQYRMLLRLLSAPQQTLRSTNLAANLRVGVSTVSAAVPHLVKEKLVTRTEDPNDMRVVSLALTVKGASAIEQADYHVAQFLQDYWRSLTPEQLEEAWASSTNAVALHDAKRIENGKFRLDTAFFDTIMISRTLTAQRLRELGLKTSELRVLLALYLLGPNVTASRIANYLFLKGSDVTSPIKALEAQGLISKERSAENRRTKLLKLTSKGRSRTEELLLPTHDTLLETCHSDEEAVRIHLSAAQSVVARERSLRLFG